MRDKTIKPKIHKTLDYLQFNKIYFDFNGINGFISKIVPNAGWARFFEWVDNAFCAKSLLIRQLAYTLIELANLCE